MSKRSRYQHPQHRASSSSSVLLMSSSTRRSKGANSLPALPPCWPHSCAISRPSPRSKVSIEKQHVAAQAQPAAPPKHPLPRADSSSSSKVDWVLLWAGSGTAAAVAVAQLQAAALHQGALTAASSSNCREWIGAA
jgi:hypothetical protein